jgi:hypothetical protein
MTEIVRTLFASDNDVDFVGIGNLLIGAESTHSALIIRYQAEVFAFHYTGYSIEFGRNSEDYFHIPTSVIHRDEVPAFIVQCLSIIRNANPVYGYFYSGESYDMDGNHLSPGSLGEVMTCTGFCLNVFKGFLEEDYLAYDDWGNAPYPNQGYVVEFCNRHGLDVNQVQASHRRITPREGLISCLFSDLPIRKTQIDGQQARVEAHFDQFSI